MGAAHFTEAVERAVAVDALQAHVVEDGITVNEKVLSPYMETTVGTVTALNPIIGYEKATALATEAYKSGKGILEIIREKNLLTEAQIKDLLDRRSSPTRDECASADGRRRAGYPCR